MKILVMNAGSSSQKSCLYDLTGAVEPTVPPSPIWEGSIDWTHQPGRAEIQVKTAATHWTELISARDRPQGIARLLETLWTGETAVIGSPAEINQVGHRVVHGGAEYRESVRITPEVRQAIARLAVFAPVHNPVNLEGIDAIAQILGDVPQVAVFDTAFHSTLPPAAYTYPGPHEWLDQGIRRYGFHGISHQYVAQRAAQLLGRNLQDLDLITCHLGNGCSLTAIHRGQSVDTTMGFTPLEGLMMGTRSGSVDPGILIHLLRQGYSADDLDRLLNQQSGLLGISGISNDMRAIHQAIEENPERDTRFAKASQRAQLALDLFIHRLRAAIGALLPSLKKLDALVFTAGIGENDPVIWQQCCEAFGFLGVRLDPTKLARSPQDQDIAAVDSAVRVLVVHTKEDWAIAQECVRLSKVA